MRSHNPSTTVSPICGAEEESGGREGDEVTEDEETVDEGSIRGPKHVRSIQTPSQEEVDKHNLTHLPFRNWCPHNMKGRGKEAPHYKAMGGSMSSLRLAWISVFLPGKEEQEP